MHEQRSRPWFLLGGAMAVGAAALFLILMAQGSGDAVENASLPPDPTLQTSATRPTEVSRNAGLVDDTESGNSADGGDRIPSDAPSSTPATVRPAPVFPPATPPPSPPAASSRPDSFREVAAPPTSSMLEKAAPSGSDEALGRQKMLSGDYRGAARHFGRDVASGSGAYTIQLLMACQDDTVRRAVESGRSSPELFILSTSFEGRSCYRVYWGRYPTQKRAQEALLRDIPSAFRGERPRVTRLAGS